MFKFLQSLLARRNEPQSGEHSQLNHGDTARQIHLLIWGGFETPEDIHDIIAEQSPSPDELTTTDHRWIDTEIQRRLADKQESQAQWPRTTDWDRLDNAFQSLDNNGIIALHYAGNTQSDGLADTMEVFDARQQAGETPQGYVFYHGQDVDTALESGRVHLAFGAFDNSEESAAGVARTVVSTVNRHGLHVSWDGSLDQRILIQPIEWRKRSPGT